MKVRCQCGDLSAEFPKTQNVGEMEQASKFFPIFTRDTELLWLCPECKATALELGRQLMEILKNEQFYFPGLLKG